MLRNIAVFSQRLISRHACSNFDVSLSVQRIFQSSLVPKCRFSTKGEMQLSKILLDEIKAEKNSIKSSNIPKNFIVKEAKGGNITLQRKDADGMVVEVCVELGGSVGMEDAGPEEEAHGLEAMPDFTIKMTKSGGKSILFNCSLNVESQELEGDSITPTYSVESVEVGTVPDYHTVSEVMDMKVFENLTELLLERELDLHFQNELQAFCTDEEHKLYCKLLEGLKDFCA